MLPQAATLDSATGRMKKGIFAYIKYPDHKMWRLTTPEVLMSLGTGFALPLMNVFLPQDLDSPDV